MVLVICDGQKVTQVVLYMVWVKRETICYRTCTSPIFMLSVQYVTCDKPLAQASHVFTALNLFHIKIGNNCKGLLTFWWIDFQ